MRNEDMIKQLISLFEVEKNKKQTGVSLSVMSAEDIKEAILEVFKEPITETTTEAGIRTITNLTCETSEFYLTVLHITNIVDGHKAMSGRAIITYDRKEIIH
jgi:hypothetical protein